MLCRRSHDCRRGLGSLSCFAVRPANRYLTEPNGLSEDWRAFTKGRFGSPNLWTDSFLCAFAQAAGLTLVTLDAKIPSREGLSRVVLLEAWLTTADDGPRFGAATPISFDRPVQ